MIRGSIIIVDAAILAPELRQIVFPGFWSICDNVVKSWQEKGVYVYCV